MSMDSAANDDDDSSSSSSSSSRDIFGYLESLPPASLLRLYADEGRGMYACRAVLQRLPELARQFAYRLVVCGGAFAMSDLLLWANGGSRAAQRDCRVALERMRRMRVITVEGGDGGGGDGGGGDDGANTGGGKSSGGKRKRGKDKKAGTGTAETKSTPAIVRLRPEFHEGLKRSMTSLQSTPWPEVSVEEQMAQHAARLESKGKEKSSSKKVMPPPTPEELEVFTQRRWDSVLHFLVGSDGEEDPPAAVVHFLEKTGLMQEDPDWKASRRHRRNDDEDEDPPLVITSRGYEFMLRDVHVQVWQFVLQYFASLSMHKKCDEIRNEALLFLICLSYCRVGGAYPASALSKDARILMKDFSQFGLVYVCKAGGGGSSTTFFYPTRVAVNLVAGAEGTFDGRDPSSSNLGPSAAATRALESALSSPLPSSSHIAVIVQTNFQLCAYTTSELHVSMLGLFCEVGTFRRLPNVIMFRITRDSVKSAFRLGIEAKQILQFLKMHAHPRLRTGDQPLIPGNVEDQILLWERERTRVVVEEVWMHQCQSDEEFEAVRRYALDVRGHGWSSEGKNKIYVRYDKAEKVMAFVRRWRARQANRR